MIKREWRVLYLILDGYPTFRPDVAALWGRYLPQEGVYSDLSTIEVHMSDPAPLWGGGNAMVYPRPANRIKEQLGSFFHDYRVLSQAPENTYDAIQVRDKAFVCIPAMWAAKRLGVPFFYWMSFPMAESLTILAGRLNPWREFPRWIFLWVRGYIGGALLRRFILPRCDHIFVQSDKMLSDLVALGLSPDRMTPVPMCIDPERFKAVPAKENINVAPKTIGYLGECSRVRRIDFLFKALSHVRKKNPNVRLLIVGGASDDADRQWLRDCMEEEGVAEFVTMTGWLPSEEVLPHFAQVDLALALMAPDPLLDSTTPTKLVEYLAMGLPVVANDHPDQNLVLSESGAGLTTPFDPIAYGDAILTLLEDDQLRSDMAQKGRPYVFAKRSYPQMASNLACVYKRLLSKRGRK